MRSFTRQFRNLVTIRPYSSALRFSEGLDPGNPRQVGQTAVFGSSPLVGQEQNSFDLVGSEKCISSPIFMRPPPGPDT